MNAPQIILLIVAIFVVQAGIWFLMSRWLSKKTGALKNKLIEQYRQANTKFIIEPQSALYRGADVRFGNVKGNGVICLTEKALLFEKITGQKIEIPRAEITGADVEKSFKGQTSLATGGRHLVVKTKEGNRIGFLLKNAEEWVRKINH
ncbi:MAG: hypothetical protein MUF69_10985 [Desulfobacterota bacterium]|jgi:hypothetical protein|nr:hypothetical protein [Thermodesulfobacteriota bacterium]